MAQTVPLTVMVSVRVAVGMPRSSCTFCWVPAAQPASDVGDPLEGGVAQGGVGVGEGCACHGDSLPPPATDAVRGGARRRRRRRGWRCARRGRRGARRTGPPGWRRRRRWPDRPLERSSLVRAVWRSSISSSAASSASPAVGSRSMKASADGAPQLGGEGAHALEHPAGGGRELGGQAGAGPLGDVLGQVARALELRDDPDDGQGVAELAGHRCLQEQQPLDVALELDHQLVDRLLAGPHAGQRVLVVAEERLVGGGHRLGHQREEPHHLRGDVVEVAVVPDAQLLRLVASRQRAPRAPRPPTPSAACSRPYRWARGRSCRSASTRFGRLVGGQLVLHVHDDGALVEASCPARARPPR